MREKIKSAIITSKDISELVNTDTLIKYSVGQRILRLFLNAEERILLGASILYEQEKKKMYETISGEEMRETYTKTPYVSEKYDLK